MIPSILWPELTLWVFAVGAAATAGVGGWLSSR